jgi:hypothetical protein
VDGWATALNNGYMRVYSGTVPTNGDTALSGNTLLAELRFGATAFAAASGGSAAANAITEDGTADASGTPTFARLFQSDGTTAVADVLIPSEVTLTPAGSITAGQIVRCTALNLSIPAT